MVYKFSLYIFFYSKHLPCSLVHLLNFNYRIPPTIPDKPFEEQILGIPRFLFELSGILPILTIVTVVIYLDYLRTFFTSHYFFNTFFIFQDDVTLIKS